MTLHRFLSPARMASHLVFASFLFANASNADTKVAFIGDQGTDDRAVAVLELVKDEGADLLSIQGDFGYEDNTADIWEDQLNSVLGKNFPVIGVAGNHENYEWPKYKKYLTRRMERVNGLSCEGDIGAKSTCRFSNIFFAQVAIGLTSIEGVKPYDNYPEYLDQELQNSSKPWKICSWHKNQNKMQVGTKSDDTGWGVYQACLKQGGIVATGHEHSYSRTYLMNDFENQKVVHRENEMLVKPGQSFVFVSGLGGRGARGQARNDDWWASIFTGPQGAKSGALFCTFGDKKADCYFKDISGAVPDSFTLESGLGPNEKTESSDDNADGKNSADDNSGGDTEGEGEGNSGENASDAGGATTSPSDGAASNSGNSTDGDVSPQADEAANNAATGMLNSGGSSGGGSGFMFIVSLLLITSIRVGRREVSKS